MGTNYNVNVTYCYRAYATPAVLECNPGNLASNYAIVIQKICPPIGSPVPLNNLIQGTLAAFDVCCGNLFNSSLTPITPLWCYTFAIPKCWQFVAGCWQPCPDAKCCVILVEWSYGGPSDPCVRKIYPRCEAPETCAEGCITWECAYPDACPCP